MNDQNSNTNSNLIDNQKNSSYSRNRLYNTNFLIEQRGVAVPIDIYMYNKTSSNRNDPITCNFPMNEMNNNEDKNNSLNILASNDLQVHSSSSNNPSNEFANFHIPVKFSSFTKNKKVFHNSYNTNTYNENMSAMDLGTEKNVIQNESCMNLQEDDKIIKNTKETKKTNIKPSKNKALQEKLNEEPYYTSDVPFKMINKKNIILSGNEDYSEGYKRKMELQESNNAMMGVYPNGNPNPNINQNFNKNFFSANMNVIRENKNMGFMYSDMNHGDSSMEFIGGNPSKNNINMDRIGFVKNGGGMINGNNIMMMNNNMSAMEDPMIDLSNMTMERKTKDINRASATAYGTNFDGPDEINNNFMNTDPNAINHMDYNYMNMGMNMNNMNMNMNNLAPGLMNVDLMVMNPDMNLKKNMNLSGNGNINVKKKGTFSLVNPLDMNDNTSGRNINVNDNVVNMDSNTGLFGNNEEIMYEGTHANNTFIGNINNFNDMNFTNGNFMNNEIDNMNTKNFGKYVNAFDANKHLMNVEDNLGMYNNMNNYKINNFNPNHFNQVNDVTSYNNFNNFNHFNPVPNGNNVTNFNNMNILPTVMNANNGEVIPPSLYNNNFNLNMNPAMGNMNHVTPVGNMNNNNVSSLGANTLHHNKHLNKANVKKNFPQDINNVPPNYCFGNEPNVNNSNMTMNNTMQTHAPHDGGVLDESMKMQEGINHMNEEYGNYYHHTPMNGGNTSEYSYFDMNDKNFGNNVMNANMNMNMNKIEEDFKNKMMFMSGNKQINNIPFEEMKTNIKMQMRHGNAKGKDTNIQRNNLEIQEKGMQEKYMNVNVSMKMNTNPTHSLGTYMNMNEPLHIREGINVNSNFNATANVPIDWNKEYCKEMKKHDNNKMIERGEVIEGGGMVELMKNTREMMDIPEDKEIQFFKAEYDKAQNDNLEDSLNYSETNTIHLLNVAFNELFHDKKTLLDKVLTKSFNHKISKFLNNVNIENIKLKGKQLKSLILKKRRSEKRKVDQPEGPEVALDASADITSEGMLLNRMNSLKEYGQGNNNRVIVHMEGETNNNNAKNTNDMLRIENEPEEEEDKENALVEIVQEQKKKKKKKGDKIENLMETAMSTGNQTLSVLGEEQTKQNDLMSILESHKNRVGEEPIEEFGKDDSNDKKKKKGKKNIKKGDKEEKKELEEVIDLTEHVQMGANLKIEPYDLEEEEDEDEEEEEEEEESTDEDSLDELDDEKETSTNDEEEENKKYITEINNRYKNIIIDDFMELKRDIVFFHLLKIIIKKKTSDDMLIYIKLINEITITKTIDKFVQLTCAMFNALLNLIEVAKDSSTYRLLLKNLGTCIGIITLGRNKPLLSKYINVKELILYSYDNGYLIVTLPPVCKILENVKNSKIFKPPNPWTVALLNLLAELHQTDSLKTILVFEIEMLFKFFELNIFDYYNKCSFIRCRSLPINSNDLMINRFSEGFGYNYNCMNEYSNYSNANMGNMYNNAANGKEIYSAYETPYNNVPPMPMPVPVPTNAPASTVTPVPAHSTLKEDKEGKEFLYDMRNGVNPMNNMAMSMSMSMDAYTLMNYKNQPMGATTAMNKGRKIEDMKDLKDNVINGKLNVSGSSDSIHIMNGISVINEGNKNVINSGSSEMFMMLGLMGNSANNNNLHMGGTISEMETPKNGGDVMKKGGMKRTIGGGGGVEVDNYNLNGMNDISMLNKSGMLQNTMDKFFGDSNMYYSKNGMPNFMNTQNENMHKGNMNSMSPVVINNNIYEESMMNENAMVLNNMEEGIMKKKEKGTANDIEYKNNINNNNISPGNKNKFGVNKNEVGYRILGDTKNGKTIIKTENFENYKWGGAVPGGEVYGSNGSTMNKNIFNEINNTGGRTFVNATTDKGKLEELNNSNNGKNIATNPYGTDSVQSVLPTHMLKESTKQSNSYQDETQMINRNTEELNMMNNNNNTNNNNNINNNNNNASGNNGIMSMEMDQKIKEELSNVLKKNLIILPKFTLFKLSNKFKNSIYMAFDTSMKNILRTVVNRFVQVGCTTTMEFIKKDFAYESKEAILHNTSLVMATSISSSLVLVHCKRPLQTSLEVNLRKCVEELGTERNNAMVEEIIRTLINDNINLLYLLIEQVAIEKACIEIGELMKHVLMYKKLARLHKLKKPDPISNKYSSILPFFLKAQNVTLKHIEVYKNFMNPKIMKTLQQKFLFFNAPEQEGVQNENEVDPIYMQNVPCLSNEKIIPEMTMTNMNEQEAMLFANVMNKGTTSPTLMERTALKQNEKTGKETYLKGMELEEYEQGMEKINNANIMGGGDTNIGINAHMNQMNQLNHMNQINQMNAQMNGDQMLMRKNIPTTIKKFDIKNNMKEGYPMNIHANSIAMMNGSNGFINNPAVFNNANAEYMFKNVNQLNGNPIEVARDVNNFSGNMEMNNINSQLYNYMKKNIETGNNFNDRETGTGISLHNSQMVNLMNRNGNATGIMNNINNLNGNQFNVMNNYMNNGIIEMQQANNHYGNNMNNMNVMNYINNGNGMPFNVMNMKQMRSNNINNNMRGCNIKMDGQEYMNNEPNNGTQLNANANEFSYSNFANMDISKGGILPKIAMQIPNGINDNGTLNNNSNNINNRNGTTVSHNNNSNIRNSEEENDNSRTDVKKIASIDLSCKKKYLFFLSELFLKGSMRKISLKESIPLYEFCILSIKEYAKYILAFPPIIPTINTFHKYCCIKSPFFKFEKIQFCETPALLLLSCLSSNHEIFVFCKIILIICENSANKNDVYKIIGTKMYKYIQETIKQNNLKYSGKTIYMNSSEELLNSNIEELMNLERHIRNQENQGRNAYRDGRSGFPGSINETSILLELELCILELLCKRNKELRKLITNYIFSSPYHNVNHISLFVRYNIIYHKNLDYYMVKYLKYCNNANIVEFCVHLIYFLVIQRKYLRPEQLGRSIRKLVKIRKITEEKFGTVTEEEKVKLTSANEKLQHMLKEIKKTQEIKEKKQHTGSQTEKILRTLTEYICEGRKEENKEKKRKMQKEEKQNDSKEQKHKEEKEKKHTESIEEKREEEEEDDEIGIIKEIHKTEKKEEMEEMKKEIQSDKKKKRKKKKNKATESGEIREVELQNDVLDAEENKDKKNDTNIINVAVEKRKEGNKKNGMNSKIIESTDNSSSGIHEKEQFKGSLGKEKAVFNENEEKNNKEKQNEESVKKKNKYKNEIGNVLNNSGMISSTSNEDELDEEEVEVENDGSSSVSSAFFESFSSDNYSDSSRSCSYYSASSCGSSSCSSFSDSEFEEEKEDNPNYNDVQEKENEKEKETRKEKKLYLCDPLDPKAEKEPQMNFPMGVEGCEKEYFCSLMTTPSYIYDIWNARPIKCKYLPAPPRINEEKGVIIACLFAEWYFIYKEYLSVLKMNLSTSMSEIVRQQHKVKCVKFFQKLSKMGFLKMDETSDQFFSHSINVSVNIALYNLEKEGEPENNNSNSSSNNNVSKDNKEEKKEGTEEGQEEKEKREDAEITENAPMKTEPIEEKTNKKNKGKKKEKEKVKEEEKEVEKVDKEESVEDTKDKMERKERRIVLGEKVNSGELLNYNYIDAWIKMIVTMLKLVDTNQISPVIILQKVLNIISRVIHKKCESEKAEFNQRPYFRILHFLMIEINKDYGNTNEILIYLNCFAKTFSVLSPLRVPAFSFSWLQLISSKYFMPKLLSNISSWNTYKKLLIAMFTFLRYFLTEAKMSRPIESLYKGTLRIFLVLLHDFPEFLSSYYVTFCNLFPLNCIQLRNLVLSAFPRNIKLPDPFMGDLKIDALEEIKYKPKILSNIVFPLFRNGLKEMIDEYFNSKDYSMLLQIRDKLIIRKKKNPQGSVVKYDFVLINSLTLYVGVCICKGNVDSPFRFNSGCDPQDLIRTQEEGNREGTNAECCMEEIFINLENKEIVKEESGKGKKKKKEKKTTGNESSSGTLGVITNGNNKKKSIDNNNNNIKKTNETAEFINEGKIKGIVVVKHNLAYTLFLFLLKELDAEGRYLLISNIVNHVRYPNAHTHYFSCLILFLFSHSKELIIQEQITRVLLERILAHRPHPWGLLITFIELIKNNKFLFWECPFVHAAVDINKLFQSVAHACLGSS